MSTKIFRVLYQDRPRWVVSRSEKLHLLEDSVTLGMVLGSESADSFLSARLGDPVEEKQSFHYLPPVEDQDVWGCGVTYFNSRRARIAETSAAEASIYDRVYSAQRPQVFPKARGRSVITNGQPIKLRTGSNWIVPEPELVLVINVHGKIVGSALGNDVSCRDIEGQNPLYQPQAKIWDSSCVLGSCIELNSDVSAIKNKEIRMSISRLGKPVFEGACPVAQIVRDFDLLAKTLFDCRSFPDGAFLFTGTGIIPPDSFALQNGDSVRISADGLPDLSNEVISWPQR